MELVVVTRMGWVAVVRGGDGEGSEDGLKSGR